ncbi:spondin domain-containing protein [Sinomicrobium weinanense]|uniref:Spondin domain-containing protein n=1 Tax=Sinomicrobium weinanense TaxID=2842200 RepID=A0A926JNK8_9FLAO|nr:spondin domain-containing protein [Sinomicrobium weinanense]MBC9794448.1 spondin domain-containing protein [Sinomicrobium weinanense]MBU3124355.1 spondin domain-containing protein [Sinomicrobium weinanense]
MKKVVLGFSATLLLLASCNNDDDNTAMPETQESTLTIENVVEARDFVQSGAFFGEGSEEVEAPVVLPGQSIQLKFNAGNGQALMFATMYGSSKDWFFAPENPGIALYDDSGSAITGDVSSKIRLWNNGTKDDSTGDPENNPVAMVSGVNAPALMKLDLAYDAMASEFTLTLTNTSGGTDNETPFSPGVWAVSNVLGGELLNPMPFYVEGEHSNPEITAIAEGGNNEPLAVKTEENTGIITGLSPAIVVVYQGNENPLFRTGEKDYGMGLKELAQKGDISGLMEALQNAEGIEAVYGVGEAPLPPGEEISIQIETTPDTKIAYATMFGYSNDWFYANSQGIAAGTTGDITAQTGLFDNGTGVDQYPGAGNNQAAFGGTPETEDKGITEVDAGYLPPVSDVIRVTIN